MEDDWNDRIAELEKVSKTELVKMAKRYGIKSPNSFDKEDLILTIVEFEEELEEEAQEHESKQNKDQEPEQIVTEKPKKKPKKKTLQFETLDEVWEYVKEQIPNDKLLPISIEELRIEGIDARKLERFRVVKLDKENKFIHSIFRNRMIEIKTERVKLPSVPENEPNQIQIKCPTCRKWTIHPNSKYELGFNVNSKKGTWRNRFMDETFDKTTAKYVLYHRGGRKKGKKMYKEDMIGAFNSITEELPLVRQWNETVEKLDLVINKGMELLEGKTDIKEIKTLQLRIYELEDQLKQVRLRKPKSGTVISLEPFLKQIDHYITERYEQDELDLEWGMGIIYYNDQLIISDNVILGEDGDSVQISKQEGEIGVVHYHPISAINRSKMTVDDIQSMVMENNILEAICYVELDEEGNVIEQLIHIFFLDQLDLILLQEFIENKQKLLSVFKEKVRTVKVSFLDDLDQSLIHTKIIHKKEGKS